MPSYLSIIDWPERMPEAERARVLSEASGLAVQNCLLAVRRGTPQVAARLEDAAADRAVGWLRAAGATAFAPRQEEMRGFRPRRLKRMSAALGSNPPMYACELWREEPAALKTEQIALIVHATLRSSEVRTQGRGINDYGGAATGFVVGGLAGAAVGAALGGADAPRMSSTTSRLSEMLDLHLRDGSCLRMDGRFNFDVLGDERGISDRENTAKLVARLSREAPRAIVDTWFPHFYCPPDVVRTHFSGAGPNTTVRTSDAPVFDFYSAWVALMYRALSG